MKKQINYSKYLCNKYNEYFRHYRYLHDNSKIINNRELLNLQIYINASVHELKELESDIKSNRFLNKDKGIISFNITNLINLLFGLVDDMIYMYALRNEHSSFKKIISGKNTNYNYEKIVEYLNIIEKDYINETCAIVCDLSSYNIKAGDIITVNNNGSFFIEIKNGKKIDQMYNVVIPSLEYSKYSLSEMKEINRINKQKNCYHSFARAIEDPSYDYDMIWPDFNNKHKTFLNNIISDRKKLSFKKYIIRDIDDYVSYILVKPSKGENCQPYYDELSGAGRMAFVYNDYLNDSFYCRPYIVGIDKSLYRDLTLNDVLLIISIDIIKLYSKLKNCFPNFVVKKPDQYDYKNNNEYIYFDRIAYIDVNGKKMYVGSNVYMRIITQFYYTDDSIDFFWDVISMLAPIPRLYSPD